MGILTGKRALITGIASNRSIAWGIASAMHREGAEIALTYQNERLRSRVAELAEKCNSTIVLPCDVSDDKSINELFASLKKSWDTFDILVHSLAFAPKEELEGDFVQNTSRQGFSQAHEISSYSLTALSKAARSLIRPKTGSILTLSYIGSSRGMPSYNVMGLAKASLEANVRYLAYSLGPENIRVNAISAGPIKTLAAAGIGGFRKILDHVEEKAPLRKNVTADEVGNAAAFLCSELASGITGEILYVDAGYHIVGM